MTTLTGASTGTPSAAASSTSARRLLHVERIGREIGVVAGRGGADELGGGFAAAEELVGDRLLVDREGDRLADADIVHRGVVGVDPQEDRLDAEGTETQTGVVSQSSGARNRPIWASPAVTCAARTGRLGPEDVLAVLDRDRAAARPPPSRPHQSGYGGDA